jgi:excisionase family DNA binding protein
MYEELVQDLRVTGKTVRRWIQAGKIHALRRGRLCRILEVEFRWTIGEGGNRMKEFDYKKALRWLKVREEKITNNIMFECKECSKTWLPVIPSNASERYDGRIMLGMLCPEECNQPNGYDIAHEDAQIEWEQETEDELTLYVEEGLKEFVSDLNGCEEGDEKEKGLREIAIKENRDELLKNWDNLNSQEYKKFIENRLAEFMEEQYANRFCSC